MKSTSAYWSAIARNWFVLLICALAGGAGGLAYNYYTAPVYTSSAQVVVVVESLGTTGDRLSGASYVQSMMPTYVAAVTSSTILDPVIDEFGLPDTAEQLRRSIDVSTSQGTSLIEISVSSDSPERAQALTSALVTSFAQLAPTMISPDGEQPSADDSDAAVPSQPSSQTVPATVTVSITDAATLPDATDAPAPYLTIALGVLSGLVIGIGIALVLGSLDTRIRTIADLEAVLDAPVLARLPRIRRSRWASRAENPAWADAIRALRSAVFRWGEGGASIQFTPAVRSAGSSSTAADLARSLAHIKASVIVIDADVKHPALSREFDLDPTPGLTDVLDDRAELEQAARSEPDAPTLHVLPPGRSRRTTDVLSGDGLPRLMGELVSRSSLVIVDTPSLSLSSDSVAVARAVGRVVIVVPLGSVAAAALRHQLKIVEGATGQRPDVVAARVPRRALTTSGPRSIS